MQYLGHIFTKNYLFIWNSHFTGYPVLNLATLGWTAFQSGDRDFFTKLIHSEFWVNSKYLCPLEQNCSGVWILYNDRRPLYTYQELRHVHKLLVIVSMLIIGMILIWIYFWGNLVLNSLGRTFYFLLILILTIAKFHFNKKVNTKTFYLARLKIKLRHKFTPLVLSKTILPVLKPRKLIQHIIFRVN